MSHRYLALAAALALTLGSRASAQVDLGAVAAGVQGCPELAADAGLGKLAAYLCQPVSRTSLDLPITSSSIFIAIRAGSFANPQRQVLLNLARGALGELEFNRLRGLLLQAAVLSRSQEALRRALLAQAADPSTPPGVATALLAQAAALVAGKFDESIPELLAARIDRDRLADLRAGVFARLGGADTIPSYAGGLVASLAGVAALGGTPVAADADGQAVFSSAGALRAAYPFFIGPDGLTNTLDDLPYVANNPAAQAAGYALGAPISGTVEDRFDQVAPFLSGSIPVYSETAQITVPSATNPSISKTVEVYGVYNPTYVTAAGCEWRLQGTFNIASGVCSDAGGEDVTAAAAQAGCPTLAASFSSTRFGIGVNADGDCIELNSSARAAIGERVQYEVLDLFGDRVLRPTVAGIEPSDLTDLALRAFPLPARPVSPNGTVVFPPVTGEFRRNVDLATGAPVVSTGETCSVRLNTSSVPIGPNGVAGDGDDVFPSAGACLLWAPPDATGAQHLASPSVVAASHGANQTLFHELCTARFDEDSARCALDSLNNPFAFGFLSNLLGGLGSLGGLLLQGNDTIRTTARPLESLRTIDGSFANTQFLAVNPLGATGEADQDVGLNLERAQAALLGCGADFANPCAQTQRRVWASDPAIISNLPLGPAGGIDLLSSDATVLVQEFSVQKALHAGELVGVAQDANDPNEPVYLPGMNYSRDGTFVLIPILDNPGAFAAIETGHYLPLTPSDVLGMSDAQRAAYQHGDPNKVQADGFVEPMPWAVDPNALATFGAVVFQSDPNDPINGPANVFNHAGGPIYGEYCGRWMNPNVSDPNTPFNQTCTALETVSANYERLIMAGEIIGQDRGFDPPESLAELAAMLDADPSNDATGDPIAGPDGIFLPNQFVFSDTQMDFEVLVGRILAVTQVVAAPANKAAALAFLASFDPTVSCTSQPVCLLQVNAVLSDVNDATSTFPLVLDLPIGFTFDQVDGGSPPQVIGLRKVNLARLANFNRVALNRLLAGEVISDSGALVRMSSAQRNLLLGSTEIGSSIPTRDVNGDGRNDLDQDHDGIWDGADDFKHGPVSDDEMLCGSGIRGDRVLQEGIQYEPYRADQAPGSAAFESLFPNGLPPRSPVFCRATNALLALVGDAPSGGRQFVWHGALPVGAADVDADSWADGIDDCPTVANSTQTDTDGDGVGDACDNCVNVFNPRVAADYLGANPWATLTGGQRDDDDDGYGNRCDARFQSATPLSGPSDLAEFRSSSGKDRALDICGISGTLPCAIFDLDEQSRLISPADLGRFRALMGKAPGPRCATCPLTCTKGATGSCN